MNNRPTPETDAASFTETNAANALVLASFACKLEQERDEALEKIKQQKLEIVRLNGATSHAGGTPLKIALRERDEARKKCASWVCEWRNLRVLCRQLDEDANDRLQERDEAKKQAAMWKANHDNQVSLKAMLMDRPDLGDRAYRIAELIRERDEAREQAQRLRVQLNHYTQANEMAEQAFRERDEAREELENVKLQLGLWEDGNLISEETLGEIRLLEEQIKQACRDRDEAHKIAERAIEDLAWFNETNARRLRTELEQLTEETK